MKPTLNRFSLPLLCAALLSLTACDGFLSADAAAELSAEEIAAVSEIAAQSLADSQEGTMSDFHDLNAGYSESGMTYGEGFISASGNAAARLWRGPNQRHRSTYDPETGEHSVSYERKVLTNLLDKSLSVNLVYVFQTEGGAFVANPRRHRDSVDVITFTGARAGYTKFTGRHGGTRHSQFERNARWQVTGITSGRATFEGLQEDEGVFKMTTPGGETSERLYEARLQTENVVVTRGNAGSELESAVTGQMHYRIKMKQTRGGDTHEKVAEGTIELEGNGQALLRILGTRQLFRIDLQTGAVAEAS